MVFVASHHSPGNAVQSQQQLPAQAAERDPFRDRGYATFAQISAQRGGLGVMGGAPRGNYTLWEAHGAHEISSGATWFRYITRVGTPSYLSNVMRLTAPTATRRLDRRAPSSVDLDSLDSAQEADSSRSRTLSRCLSSLTSPMPDRGEIYTSSTVPEYSVAVLRTH